MNTFKAVVHYNGKEYIFTNGTEVMIFHAGIFNDVPEEDLIPYVSLVYDCYLKDNNDTPLGHLCDFIAEDLEECCKMSRLDILTEFYRYY